MLRNTRNKEQIRPYQPPNDAKRNQRAWGLTIHEQRTGTSGNPERRTTKGSSWENFQLGRDGISSLGKNDKRKDSQKAEFEKVRGRSLVHTTRKIKKAIGPRPVGLNTRR